MEYELLVKLLTVGFLLTIEGGMLWFMVLVVLSRTNDIKNMKSFFDGAGGVANVHVQRIEANEKSE